MNQLFEISLDELGRILIPEAIRSRLGLTPGMTLVVEKGDNGGVWLRPHPEQPVLVDKGGILVVKAKPLSGLSDIVRQERDQRVSELVRRVGL